MLSVNFSNNTMTQGDSDMTKLMIPPHDMDAEAAVLSAVMIDGKKIESILAIIQHEMFYSEAHRRIFEACTSLFKQGQPIDTVQVATWLRNHSRLDQVGGLVYLTEVLNSAPSLSEDHVKAYATTVLSKHKTRQIISTCQEISAKGYSDIEDVALYANDSIEQLQSACDVGNQYKAVERLGIAIKESFTELAGRVREGQSCLAGIPSGFKEFDKILAGWHAGDLTIIGARPGAGKTAFVLSACLNLANNLDKRYASLFFSLEMPKYQLANRAACSYGKIDLSNLRNGTMTNKDWSNMAAAAQHLYDAPIYIDDQSNIGVSEMRTKIRQTVIDSEKKGVRLALVVVDYLQLMRASNEARKKNSRIAEIDELVQDLKNLAKSFGVSVVAISQLSRGVENRDDRRPRMSDLRESGSIEAAADNIIGLYRDDYYSNDGPKNGIIEAIVLKQRNGPIGTIKFKFDEKYTTIRDGDDD